MDIARELALLTDAEAERCLNGILKGMAVANPEFERVVASPDDLALAIRNAGIAVGLPSRQVREIATENRPRAVRAILVTMAEDSNFRPRVEAWLTSERPTLLDPVTSALVLAGIVALLSTHVTLEYENVGGKRKLRIKVEKKPNAKSLLEKFFGLF